MSYPDFSSVAVKEIAQKIGSWITIRMEKFISSNGCVDGAISTAFKELLGSIGPARIQGVPLTNLCRKTDQWFPYNLHPSRIQLEYVRNICLI